MSNLVERAFELARNGDCNSVDDIRRRLSRENFTGVEAHLAGSGIRKQLRGLMRVQQAPSGAAG